MLKDQIFVDAFKKKLKLIKQKENIFLTRVWTKREVPKYRFRRKDQQGLYMADGFTLDQDSFYKMHIKEKQQLIKQTWSAW